MSNGGLSVKVRYFASTRELTGVKSEELTIIRGATVANLITILVQKYPNGKEKFEHFLYAVNQDYVDHTHSIKDQDEIAIFPPVSGGSGQFPTITLICGEEPDLNYLIKQIQSSSTGAAVIFTGFVRGKSPGTAHPQTNNLEYEAYQPMAEKMMLQIADEIRTRWPAVYGVFLVQRIGLLNPFEITTAIGVTTGHRTEGCFEAARYGIDRLKEIVPVWKKENGPNGEEWIEGSHHPNK